jgi:HAD superfamily hydrolase (TIGR01490 family)
LRAAYFDVDGTLVGTNLLHPTLKYLMTTASPLESARRVLGAALDAPNLLAAELKDRKLFNERLFFHFKGMSQDRMEFLSDEVFDTVIRPRIFRGSVELVEQCRSAGLRIILVTGSLACTVAPLAAHLGADQVIANRLEYKEGYATGRLSRPVVAGPEKARIMVADARERGIDLAGSHAYSDSFSDVPMLSLVGHPFCINPDAKLAKLARSYHWSILDIDRLTPGEHGLSRRRKAFGFFG